MSARKGRQTPTFEQIDEYTDSDGKQAAKLASEFWGDPISWQLHFLDVMLARDVKDKYKFHTVGISLSRQNGKSWDVRSRCFYGLVADGEKILYTCQHGDTADEMFKALAEPFEDEDEYELHDLLKTVRKTNGQQAIYLKNGGYIRFTTRTNSLARGKSYDVIIYDEAQELTATQQSASLPTISASSKHNTQVIYLGTPPGPESPGEVFDDIHAKIHAGKAKDMAWMEWSVDEIGDVTDKSRWYETNPSLGYLIDEVAIQTECDSMPADEFARERLGWWSKGKAFKIAIDPVSWDACATKDPPKGGKTAYAVKFDVEGKWAALSACAIEEDKPPHVELIEIRPMPDSLAWLAQFIAKRSNEASSIVIDGRAYSGALNTELINLGVPQRYITLPNSQDVCTAAQMLVTKTGEHSITHFAQPDLDRCVKGCSKRTIGHDGGWGFGDGSAPGYPVESIALALWGDITTRRDPNGGVCVW